MLIYILADLLWQPDYTPRVEVGLPQINIDAPRLLAHCFLYELDTYLNSDPNRDFVRYMDEIDIGVDTIVEAKQALKTVDLVLQTKQIRLNSGKTVILTQNEAIHHFRILENARLDRVQACVERRLKSVLSLERQCRLVQGRIRQGLRKNAFDTGNGDKILKRWIGLAAKTKAKLKSDVVEDLVRRRPSVRNNIYFYVRSKPLILSISLVIARASRSGLLIDDAASVEMANYLVEKFVKTRNCHREINAIIDSNDDQTNFGLYAKIWLQSKYGTTADILDTLERNRKVWSPHEGLGRLAASLAPLF